jgi:hypothetical protein
MSAPASGHEQARRRAALIIEREYKPDADRCVRAVLALLKPRLSVRPPENETAESDQDSAASGGR